MKSLITSIFTGVSVLLTISCKQLKHSNPNTKLKVSSKVKTDNSKLSDENYYAEKLEQLKNEPE
jgi:hypothetical protein